MGIFTSRSRAEGASEPVRLLVADHEKVEAIFEEIEAEATPAERRRLVGQLATELSVHTHIEEKVLYPFIRSNVGDGHDMIDEAEREHDEADAALAALLGVDPGSAEFGPRLMTLRKLVDHHVKEEEGQVFPALDSAVDGTTLGRLAGDLTSAKAGQTGPPEQTQEVVGEGLQRVMAGDVPRTGGSSRTAGGRSGRSRGPGRSRPAVWVQPHRGDDRWQVKRESASRASRVFDTQSEAESFGRDLARREGAEFVLTGRDGAVRAKNSYGNDPADVKG